MALEMRDNRLFSIFIIMKFSPMEVLLKNGERVTIRECTENDALLLMATTKTYLADSDYIPKLPQEFSMTEEKQKEWVRSLAESRNSLLLIAEKNGIILGNIDITGSKRKAMEHTAVIGMGMLIEWRNSGLGAALMTAAVDWAKQNDMLSLLWLQVYTENAAGLALYRKCGFVENGVIQGFFRHGGNYFDQLTMSLAVG
jgi:RimJ/RimL family protein N-acetyltransferase